MHLPKLCLFIKEFSENHDMKCGHHIQLPIWHPDVTNYAQNTNAHSECVQITTLDSNRKDDVTQFA